MFEFERRVEQMHADGYIGLSEIKGVRLWCLTEKGWRTLVAAAERNIKPARVTREALKAELERVTSDWSK